MTIDWPDVRVSALFDGRLARDVADFAPTHIVSLIDPDLPEAKRPALPHTACILQRPFFDVHSPADRSADAAIVGDLIGFLSDWAADAFSHRLLSHCHMGASRSTAAAYLALAIQAGPAREPDAFARLLTITNKPWPNRLVIQLADDALGRGGALITPLDTYRTKHPRRLHAYGRLNARRGLY